MTADPGPLERRLSEAVLASAPDLRERLESDPEAHLELVVLLSRAGDRVAALLQSAVTASRAAGHSWESIGRSLGVTRQGAQQRFGSAAGEPTEVAGGRRVLRPLTAFNEMAVLERAGRYGWHSVEFGPLYHVVESSDHQWEHRRVPVWSPDLEELEASGWRRIGAVWFPWAYFARPTDVAALAEPVAEDHLMG